MVDLNRFDHVVFFIRFGICYICYLSCDGNNLIVITHQVTD